MSIVRVAMAQINCTVGDLDGNSSRICGFIEKAKIAEAHIIAFPELALLGYPPEDLLLKAHFIEDSLKALDIIEKSSRDITTVIGMADFEGCCIANSAAIIHKGGLVDVYHKTLLPNYGVFDEKRYFVVGKRWPVYALGSVRFGVGICQDVWEETGPVYQQAIQGGAEILIIINSSPYHMSKWKEREKMLKERAISTRSFICYTNMVGGQDELVFDGQSVCLDPHGRVVARGQQFEEDLVVVDIDTSVVAKSRKEDKDWQNEVVKEKKTKGKVSHVVVDKDNLIGLKEKEVSHVYKPLSPNAEVFEALKLGVKDYVRKNRFERVVIGISGGIDSALALTIAADALGSENVKAVAMPSRFSKKQSLEDAKVLTANLGVRLRVVPIDDIFQKYEDTLAPSFEGMAFDVTEENIQARIRGNILMALANKFGWLVLATGNKSELAVGYATLYGDMAGGFEVIKDVPKTMVYTLAEYRNSIKEVIPGRIIKREPTAELRPDQKDTDALPPYSELDPIIFAYVEEDRSAEEIIADGFDEETVRRIIRMIDQNEYKRRQAPPGIKITPKAFGKDRRLPITNWYKR